MYLKSVPPEAMYLKSEPPEAMYLKFAVTKEKNKKGCNQ